MALKAINFTEFKVKATLEGRKTQDRFEVRYKKKIEDPKVGFTAFTEKGEFSVRGKHEDGKYGESFFKLPYAVGDILWVRETWQVTDFLHISDENYGYIYRASENGKDWEDNDENWKWKPSIHMPIEACRLFIKVTSIKAERLQDISAGDALNEGIEYWNLDKEAFDGGEFIADYKNYMWRDDEKYEDYHFPSYANSIYSFKSLWQSIKGDESYTANPFVFAISYEVIDNPLKK